VTTVTESGSLADFAAACGLELEPFQRRIARAAAGPEREFVCLLPRGCGKTTLLALIALHHLVTVERAAVYCAAASREQARILFESAQEFARRLEHPNIVDRHLELRWCPNPDEPRVFDRHLRVLAADAPRLHGLTPSLAVIDEMHAHRTDDVYLALRTAALKRPDSKLIVISTAAQGHDSPLAVLRRRALAQPEVKRRGAITDARGPDVRMLEWAVPEDGDLDDPRTTKAANPASWVTLEGLRAQRAAVHDLAFRRYHANQFTTREGYWLPPGAWQACAADYEIERGEAVWIGVDVGGSRSASAVVWITAPEGGNPQALPRHAVPSRGLPSRATDGGQDTGMRVGCAIYTGTEAVLQVQQKVRDLASEFDVREVRFDPWRFQQAALELEAEGLTVVEFPQSNARMTAASERLYAAVIEGRLRHPNDPELNAHVAAAVARDTPRGWRLDKADRSAQIDATVAMAMAVEAVESRREPARLLGWLGADGFEAAA
jgi:phage terminase large subunit-like protein